MYAEYVEDKGLLKKLADWLRGYSGPHQQKEPFESPYKYCFCPVELNEKTQKKFETGKNFYVLCDKDGNLATDSLFVKNVYGSSNNKLGRERYALVSLCVPKKYSKEILDMCEGMYSANGTNCCTKAFKINKTTGEVTKL